MTKKMEEGLTESAEMQATQRQPIYQLEIRPEMRGSIELRLLVKALLLAAREELGWEQEQRLGSGEAA